MNAHYEEITSCGLWPAPGLYGKDDRTPPREIEVEMCRRWLRDHVTPTKTIRKKRSSYTLKHAVESWTRSFGPHEQIDFKGRSWTGGYLYIANGAFIEAARLEGFQIARTIHGSPNAYFNFTEKRR